MLILAAVQKSELIAHLKQVLAEKVDAIRAYIAATLHARNSDTKSSAGDKHEVGRAMIQQELDQQEAQLAKLHGLQQELERVPMDRVYERAAFGSLVTTDHGIYFIAIGMGLIDLGREECYVISLASPAGQALKDSRVGEAVTFGGRTITISGIT